MNTHTEFTTQLVRIEEVQLPMIQHIEMTKTWMTENLHQHFYSLMYDSIED